MKETKFYLQHILEAIDNIENFTKGMEKEQFMKNVLVHSAVIRQLEVIGEAVKNLPEKYKANHTEIPWKKIAGMRDVLIHEYFDIDVKAVWDTIYDDLPTLKKQIRNIIKQYNYGED